MTEAPSNPEKVVLCHSCLHANPEVEGNAGYNEFSFYFGRVISKNSKKKIPLIWTLFFFFFLLRRR